MSTTPPTDPVPPNPDTPPPGDTTVPYTTGTPAPDPADVEKNKIFAILAYLGILVLVPILAAKDSPFARYHANQGLILCITAIVLGIVIMVISAVAAFVPVVGWCASCVLSLGFAVGILAFVIMGILNAVNGRMQPLPLIGNYTLLK